MKLHTMISLIRHLGEGRALFGFRTITVKYEKKGNTKVYLPSGPSCVADYDLGINDEFLDTCTDHVSHLLWDRNVRLVENVAKRMALCISVLCVKQLLLEKAGDILIIECHIPSIEELDVVEELDAEIVAEEESKVEEEGEKGWIHRIFSWLMDLMIFKDH